MNFNIQTLRRFWYIVLLLCLVSLVFYLGYLYGIREQFNAQPDKVTSMLSNGFQANTLTPMKIRDIQGVLTPTREPQVVGSVYYLVNDQKKTYVRFIFKDVPVVIKSSQQQKELPEQLNIMIAQRNEAGDDFNYRKVGVLKFNPPVNQKRGADYSTIVDIPLYNKETSRSLIDRIEFQALKPEDPTQRNIFSESESNANLPVKVRGNSRLGIPSRTAPYFWVNFF